MKKDKIITLLSSIYVLAFAVLATSEKAIFLVYIMFAFSPIVVGYTAYIILKQKPYSGKVLQQQEHWGYQYKLLN